MAAVPTLKIKKKHVKPMHAGHPWVFADAIEAVPEKAVAGGEVRIQDQVGNVLGRGYFSPDSAIAVRLLSHQDEPLDTLFLRRRLKDAVALRLEILKLGTGNSDPDTTAYRLVNSEGDWLGGLTIDIIGRVASVQFGTAGMYERADSIMDWLQELIELDAIVDRTDPRVRRLEQLPAPPQGERAVLRGELPEEPQIVTEFGIEFAVDWALGGAQKTGFYTDQRSNRVCF